MGKTAQRATTVAPLVGAWIEIHGPWRKGMVNKVAPLVGAWIEIEPLLRCSIHKEVAPLVGAWIEMLSEQRNIMSAPSRSSCRSVD